MSSSYPSDNNAPVGLTDEAALTDRIRRLFSAKLNINVPDGETDLIGTGTLDSLALVDLLLEIESEFQVTIPFEQLDIDSFRTLSSIGRFVAVALAGRDDGNTRSLRR